MVHSKTRWKWHECLQARDEFIDNDSEYENDDYAENTFITIHQQGLNNEHHEINESNSSSITNINKDIYTEQEKLKEKAKLAFVLSAKMARMQVEIERQILKKKRPSIYNIVGIETYNEKSLNIEILEEMNIGQLQVIVNDLYNQIEMNNDELVNLLIERDSLSMEQDSILVDIEDLTKRLQERTMNLSKQSSLNESKQHIYDIKHLEQDSSKKSIFKNLLKKAMFI